MQYEKSWTESESLCQKKYFTAHQTHHNLMILKHDVGSETIREPNLRLTIETGERQNFWRAAQDNVW